MDDAQPPLACGGRGDRLCAWAPAVSGARHHWWGAGSAGDDGTLAAAAGHVARSPLPSATNALTYPPSPGALPIHTLALPAPSYTRTAAALLARSPRPTRSR